MRPFGAPSSVLTKILPSEPLDVEMRLDPDRERRPRRRLRIHREIAEPHVPRRPAVRDHEEQKAPVPRQVHPLECRRIAGLLLHDGVVLRVGAEPVQAHLRVARPVGRRDLRVHGQPRVIEALAVRCPRRARVLAALDDVHAGDHPGRDVHHVKRRLVGVVDLLLVGDARPVPGNLPVAERGAAVRAPGVRVEEHLFRAVGSLFPVHDLLFLVRMPPREEIPRSPVLGGRDDVDVEELLQPRGDRVAPGQRCEALAGEVVLGLHPGLHLGRLRVLEPAVGVGHRDAVQDVRDVHRSARRIGRSARPLRPRGPGVRARRAGREGAAAG